MKGIPNNVVTITKRLCSFFEKLRYSSGKLYYFTYLTNSSTKLRLIKRKCPLQYYAITFLDKIYQLIAENNKWKHTKKINKKDIMDMDFKYFSLN